MKTYRFIRKPDDLEYARRLLCRLNAILERLNDRIRVAYTSDWSDPQIVNDTPQQHYYWLRIANRAIDGIPSAKDEFNYYSTEIPTIIKAYYILAMDLRL